MPGTRRTTAPLVGRTEELAALSDALDAAADGDLVIVLVGGDPGVGKTAVVRSFAEETRAAGIPVDWAGCSDVGGSPAFWPWIQVLRSLGDDAVAAAQERLGSHGDEPFVAFETVHEMLRRQGRGVRMVVLDDLHTADLPSLELLRFLAGTAHDLPLLVVATHRLSELRHDEARDVILADVAEHARLLRPGLLGIEDVATLVARSVDGGDPDDAEDPSAVAQEVLDRSGGNAFYVAQLVDAVSRGGPEQLARLPEGVRAAVRARLAPLGDETRDLLARCSVLGPPLRRSTLAGMTGCSEAEVGELLRPALDLGVLVVDGDGLAFDHTLVREAVVDELPVDRRRTEHLAAATALAARRDGPAPAAAVAQHLIDAGPRGADAEVARWCDAAAGAAEALGGHREVARWSEVAASRWAAVGDHDRQAAALVLAVAAHGRAGDGAPALRLSDDLAELARRTGSGSLLATAALARADVFEPAQDLDAPPLLREALGHPGVAGDLAVRADLLTGLASILGMPSIDGVRRDPEGARQAVAELDDLAGAGDRRGRARLAEARLHVDSGPAHFLDRRRWLAELNAVFPPGPSLLERLQRVYWSTSLAFEAGDLREVHRRTRAWQLLAERSGSTYWAWRVQMARAGLAYARGRLDEAEHLAVSGLPLVANLNPEMAFLVTSGFLFTIRRDQGRLDELGRSSSDFGVLGALVAADRGDREEAARLLDQVVAAAEATGPDDLYWLCLLALAANTAASIGDVERCRWAAELLAPFADQFVMWGRSYVFGSPVVESLGVARRGAGDRAGAEEAFRSVLRWADGADAPGFGVRARLGLASVLPVDAAERARLLGQARVTAAHLGMVPAVAEADALVASTEAVVQPGIEVHPAAAGIGEQARVRIRTLGRFEVVAAGSDKPARWSSRKARDALKILISRRGRSLPREELIDLLWPEVDLATGRTRLSVVLSMVRAALDPRKLLPSDPLQADRQAVALDLDLVLVDVEDLLAVTAEAISAVEREQPGALGLAAEALALADRGAFLAEDPYADWSSALRATMDRDLRHLTRAAARLAARSGATEDALRWWRRVLELDPDDRDGRDALLRALVEAGRHGEADIVRAAHEARRRALGLD